MSYDKWHDPQLDRIGTEILDVHKGDHEYELWYDVILEDNREYFLEFKKGYYIDQYGKNELGYEPEYEITDLEERKEEILNKYQGE